ncbi:lysine transporter LysE [Flavobacterium salilacus subsp. salilacus]|uniref:lysine transporter LysE n=1 Tax=Flavobacterium TaxID=237 RepID=UPI0010753C73|nr:MULTISPECIES: lysine transporter LysE [Flavobacterium]KAF2520091.1 lysine transporter LysE [Flavobacterium salilacus subsp. salilacus]MBE1613993.1 lysine transporter LysE [Flavobacterium sp. SaA2.13]
MELVLPVVLGIVLAAAGISLPGLLNITAAKISLNEGRQRAVIFALGATSIIFVQTYIAVSFAKFINSRPDIIYLLEEMGLGIFAVLTIYFLFFAKKPKPKNGVAVTSLKSRKSKFFLGVLLSALNFFPVPYYVFMSVTLSKHEYFYFNPLFIFLFVMGAVIGSFSVFYLYIISFKKFEHKAAFFLCNINYFMGGITGVVCIITIIKMMRN